MDTSEARDYFVNLQQRIVARLEAIDGCAFRRDAWERPAGGDGVSCVIEQGNVFERGGVNFSHVNGDSLPPSATATRPQLAGRGFGVDRKSTRLNSSHTVISYAVFCLKKKRITM